MKPLLWAFQFAFGCHHQLSGVFTIQKRTYRVCLECGQEVEYCRGRTAFNTRSTGDLITAAAPPRSSISTGELSCSDTNRTTCHS
jgi:hypothetical protein